MSFDKNLITYLESLWLESQEPIVYLTALSLGTVPASIIARKLDIPRSTARYICEQLVRKWLMLFTQKANTKLFTAENPNKLYSIIHAEQEKLNYKTEKLAEVVQSMQKLHNPTSTLPKITFFEWEDWIERLFGELLVEPTDLYSFWAWDYILAKNPKLITRFRNKATKKYKNVYVVRSPKYKNLHEWKDPANFKTKYFEKIEENKVDIQITKDKLSIISVDNDTPIWVLIKHKNIVEAFQKIFEELWGKL